MTQSKLGSFVESLVDTGTGYIVALLTQAVVFPIFNIYISYTDHFLIAAIFVIVSLIRKYIFRRIFNWLTLKGLFIENK